MNTNSDRIYNYISNKIIIKKPQLVEVNPEGVTQNKKPLGRNFRFLPIF